MTFSDLLSVKGDTLVNNLIRVCECALLSFIFCLLLDAQILFKDLKINVRLLEPLSVCLPFEKAYENEM